VEITTTLIKPLINVNPALITNVRNALLMEKSAKFVLSLSISTTKLRIVFQNAIAEKLSSTESVSNVKITNLAMSASLLTLASVKSARKV
jgi:hypothetical protein